MFGDSEELPPFYRYRSWGSLRRNLGSLRRNLGCLSSHNYIHESRPPLGPEIAQATMCICDVRSMQQCWGLQIGHNGSIYATEIGRCCKPGLPPFPAWRAVLSAHLRSMSECHRGRILEPWIFFFFNFRKTATQEGYHMISWLLIGKVKFRGNQETQSSFHYTHRGWEWRKSSERSSFGGIAGKWWQGHLTLWRVDCSFSFEASVHGCVS